MSSLEKTHPKPVDSRPPIEVTPHLTLQRPLSRRGFGPGLILVVERDAPLGKSERHLDPPPLIKWAEEGYAVAQLTVPKNPEENDDGLALLESAARALSNLHECDREAGYGLISYLIHVPLSFRQAIYEHPSIAAIVSYNGQNLETSGKAIPQLIHIPLAGERRAAPDAHPDQAFPEIVSSLAAPSKAIRKPYCYTSAQVDTQWMLPSSEAYSSSSATLSHTRTLSFLKPIQQGPYFNLEEIWEEHCQYEFEERSVERTMATMVAEPYVNHIPVLTGGIGKVALTNFYTHHFIFVNPLDTDLELVSRTVGVDRVIDEFVCNMTHDRIVDWLLPGVPPTGRKLRVPMTSVVAIRGDRLCHEHISWDQATVLKQLGLLPEWANFPYPIGGQEAQAGKRFEVRLPVVGEDTAKKLADEGSVESNRLLAGESWREVSE